MKHNTLALEMTQEEVRAVKFALLADFETVNENIDDDDDWRNDSLILGRVLDKLESLEATALGTNDKGTTYSKSICDYRNTLAKRQKRNNHDS
jgi:hypothetical protein